MSDIKKWMDIVVGAELLAANIASFQDNIEQESSPTTATAPVTVNVSLNMNDLMAGTKQEEPAAPVYAAPALSKKGSSNNIQYTPKSTQKDLPVEDNIGKDTFSENDTVMITPSAGGGVGRFVKYTSAGAIIDIKGQNKEYKLNDLNSINNDDNPSVDELKTGNNWFHSSIAPDTVGSMKDKPEFRPGDMVKVDDVYGTVIGPGYGIFVAYSTSGQECIISFDSKTITVATEKVSAVLEQNAKDNFKNMDNDGNLSPISLGADNVKVKESMNNQDEFSKWISAVEEALADEGKPLAEEKPVSDKCGCDKWSCKTCFPDNTENKETTPSKGVKLGDIVSKTEYKFRDGIDSPLTNTEDDLTEIPVDFAEEPQNAVDVEQPLFGEEVAYADEATAPPIGPKKTTTKTKPSIDDLSFLDLDGDTDDNALTVPDSDDGEFDDTLPDPEEPQMDLPAASRQDTQDRLAGMTPDPEMMNWMSRINRDAITPDVDNPVIPVPQNELVVRTARDVPAVISTAMQAAGVQSPDWHHVRNLPGMNDAHIRGMGRSVFSMFTSTPVGDIQTIANVGGQGPNTDAEMRAVAGWLRDNAEDMGIVDVSHGLAIPGYRPDVKEYRANGIRFHVVRDPQGQYIYAYPDNTARIQGPGAQPPGRALGGRNTPRLRENIKGNIMGLSLFEELALDEKVREAIRVSGKSDIDESARSGKEYAAIQNSKKKAAMAARLGNAKPTNHPVARLIGKKEGARRLIQFVHGVQKLSNEAEMVPVPVSGSKNASQLAWAYFNNNGDDFIFVSGQGGVAAIKPNKASVEKYRASAAKKKPPHPPVWKSHNGSIRYEVIAFSSNGERIPANLLQPAGAVMPNDADLDDFQDPTAPKIQTVKARMGLANGRDTQNPNNVFNLLNDKIGPIVAVWMAGWDGLRGGPEELSPSSPGAVERNKIAHREYNPGVKSTPRPTGGQDVTVSHKGQMVDPNFDLATVGDDRAKIIPMVDKPEKQLTYKNVNTSRDLDTPASRPAWHKNDPEKYNHIPGKYKQGDEKPGYDIEKKTWRKTMPGEPGVYESASTNADAARQRDNANIRYASKATKPAAPRYFNEQPAIAALLNKLGPTLVIRITNEVIGLVKAESREAGTVDERYRLDRHHEALEKVKVSLDATKDPTSVMSLPVVVDSFKKAIIDLSGAENEYDPKFKEYIRRITSPTPAIHGRQVPGDKAHSVEMQQIRDALRRAMLAG